MVGAWQGTILTNMFWTLDQSWRSFLKWRRTPALGVSSSELYLAQFIFTFKRLFWKQLMQFILFFKFHFFTPQDLRLFWRSTMFKMWLKNLNHKFFWILIFKALWIWHTMETKERAVWRVRGQIISFELFCGLIIKRNKFRLSSVSL